MNKKSLFLSVVLLVLASGSMLFAHEFWIMPSKFKVKIGEIIQFDFFVGEDFQGELWGKRKDRLQILTHFDQQKQEDWTNVAIQNDSTHVGKRFETEGTHLITMQSKNSFIALEADKFNEYLKEDGLEDIYQLRQKNNQLNEPSKELYRRCAKTLVQVGEKTNTTFKKNTGMPLEIIPLNNPYSLKNGEKLTVKVLFEGKPLKNKMVVAWNKTPTVATQHEKYYTNKKGNITFTPSQKGYWLISTVHMIPLVNNPEGNYQSFWGSLTFEL